MQCLPVPCLFPDYRVCRSALGDPFGGIQLSGGRWSARIDAAQAIASGPLTAKKAIFCPANGHFFSSCVGLFSCFSASWPRHLVIPSAVLLLTTACQPSCPPAAIPKCPVALENSCFGAPLRCDCCPSCHHLPPRWLQTRKTGFFFFHHSPTQSKLGLPPPTRVPPAFFLPLVLRCIIHHTRAYSAAGPTLLLHSSPLHHHHPFSQPRFLG